MANRRDYGEEYRRRQERAQAEGFASDYERRMARAPQGDRLEDTEAREYLRGHRGEQFLRDHAREGDAVQISDERDSDGRFTTLDFYPADPDREPRTISIRDLSTDEIHDLLDDLDDEGVAVSAGYLEE
jgi:hypothetical protein